MGTHLKCSKIGDALFPIRKVSTRSLHGSHGSGHGHHGGSGRHRKLPKDTQLAQQIMDDFLIEISDYLQRDRNTIHSSEEFNIHQIVEKILEIILSDNHELQSLLTNDMDRKKVEAQKSMKSRDHKVISNSERNETVEGGSSGAITGSTGGTGDHHRESSHSQNSDGSDLPIETILDLHSVRNGTNTGITADGEDGNNTGNGTNTPLTSLNRTWSAASDLSRLGGLGGGLGFNNSERNGYATQKTVALTWLDTFITLGGPRLKRLYPRILKAILYAMNDGVIQSTAQVLNGHLMELVLHLDPLDDIDNEEEANGINSVHDGNPYKHKGDMEGIVGVQSGMQSQSATPGVVASAAISSKEEDNLVDYLMNELKEDDGVNLMSGDEEMTEENASGSYPQSKYDSFDIKSVMNILIDALQDEQCAIHSRLAALDWISSLLVDLPFHHIPNDKLLSVCFTRLCDTDSNDAGVRQLQNEVTNKTLEVLARLSLHPKIFEQLLADLLALFCRNKRVLHSKGKLIITKLCSLLDCTKIYSLLADLIAKDYSTGLFVGNILNTLLLRKCHDQKVSN